MNEEKKMKIKKLQRQAADSTDELLAISEDIGSYVISAYGSVSGELFTMQCKIQLARCRRLIESIRETDEALAGVASCTGSIALTRRLLAQNLLLAEQKQSLLEDFLAHSDSVRSRLKDARDMEDRAGILRLQNTLRRELSPCRSEKENGN